MENDYSVLVQPIQLKRTDPWVHPEAQQFIEHSVSSCIWLVYIFRSREICQSDTKAHWALSERSCFWMHPLGTSRSI